MTRRRAVVVISVAAAKLAFGAVLWGLGRAAQAAEGALAYPWNEPERMQDRPEGWRPRTDVDTGRC